MAENIEPTTGTTSDDGRVFGSGSGRKQLSNELSSTAVELSYNGLSTSAVTRREDFEQQTSHGPYIYEVLEGFLYNDLICMGSQFELTSTKLEDYSIITLTNQSSTNPSERSRIFRLFILVGVMMFGICHFSVRCY